MILKIPKMSITTKEGAVIARKANVAIGYFYRLLGLMFRKNIPFGSGFIFYCTNGIHSCFMRFPLDVMFLSGQGKVLKLYYGLKPWRFAGCLRASIAVELPSGTLLSAKVKIGDVLIIAPI